MKKVIVILTSMFLLGFVLTGFAANNNLKIGVVKVSSVLKNSAKFSRTKKQLKSFLDKNRKTITAARNNVQAEMSQLQKQGPKMSASARSALQTKIKTDQKDFMQLSQRVSSDANARQTKEMKKLSDTLKAAIRTVAKKDGLSFVFTDQAAIYFDNQFDVTKQVSKVFG